MATTHNNPLIGKWKIVEMEKWDQHFVDLEVPGHFTFKQGNVGEFQFGMVQGELDCCVQDNRIEFSWTGSDDADEASGRGWVELVDGELRGRIFIHFGDNSAFRAVKFR